MRMVKRVVVHGRVQGVFFRDSVRREAQSRGVTGWVRNTSDGTVEAVFEGDDADVEALVDACRSGPPDAAVSDVEVFEADSPGADGFSVR